MAGVPQTLGPSVTATTLEGAQQVIARGPVASQEAIKLLSGDGGGFSEMLYAYTSGAATNGSAFAGLNANTPFYNLTLAAAMFAGRFLVIIPVLCIAGMLVAKGRVPPAAGTMPTHGVQFVALLVGTILIVGGLTFMPALVLGPVAEHFVMQAGMTY